MKELLKASRYAACLFQSFPTYKPESLGLMQKLASDERLLL